MTKLLLIDDDSGGRDMAAFNLRKAGHEVEEAATGAAGLEMFEAGDYDLVVTDVRMPGISGIEVTRTIRNSGTDAAVIVITAFGKVEVAVEAMRAGATDFLVKPFSRDQLELTVNRALERRRLTRENRDLKRKLRGIERPIVGGSVALKDMLEIADRVALSDASVLVSGESGTLPFVRAPIGARPPATTIRDCLRAHARADRGAGSRKRSAGYHCCRTPLRRALGHDARGRQ